MALSAPSTGHRSSMTSNQAARRHGPLLVRSARAVVLAVGIAVVGVVGGLGEVPAAGSPTSGWLPPLEPLIVVHGFDPPAGPYAPGHRGVDLAAGVGQPVGSAADGVVSYAGRIAGVGVVAVVHGRIRTTYQPLEVTTTRGATVSAGDEIGRLDQAGSHCAPDPCLHWGALIGDTYVDPLHLLNPGPSRLMPYWDVAAQRGHSSRGRRGRPPERAGDPRALVAVDNAALHPRVGGTAAALVRPGPPQGVTARADVSA